MTRWKLIAVVIAIAVLSLFLGLFAVISIAPELESGSSLCYSAYLV